MGWIDAEWKMQWPLVRFELYKYGVIVMGSAALTFGARLLHGAFAIADTYFYGGIFILSCIGFGLLLKRLGGPAEARPPKQTAEVNTALPVLPSAAQVTVRTVDDIYNSLDVHLTRETEASLRGQIALLPSAMDRENLLVRALVSSLVIYDLEEIWNNIYGSQINALLQLNTHAIARVDVQQDFYAPALAAWPQGYVFYTFDMWLGYLRGQTLVLEEGNMVAITVKGRAFLKLMIDSGRSAAQKIM